MGLAAAACAPTPKTGGNPTVVMPGLEEIAPRFPPQVRRQLLSGALEAPKDKEAAYQAAFPAMLRLLKALYDVGITIIPGTDNLAGYMLHHELELYVRAGIPAGEVLRMATLTPALVMGVDKDRGVIAAGKLADMVLIDGEDFAQLCKDNSEDPGSKDQGGDLGFFTKDRMVEPFAIAAFALKVNQVSDVVDAVAGEHGVAEIGSAPLKERPADHVIAGRVLEVEQKGLVLALQRHFLQRDDVGVELEQHADDPRRRVAAVGAHCAVDVPGGYTQLRRRRRRFARPQ